MSECECVMCLCKCGHIYCCVQIQIRMQLSLVDSLPPPLGPGMNSVPSTLCAMVLLHSEAS